MDEDVQKHFYDAVNLECNPKSWGFMPAAAFEAAHGLSGVATYYKFPETKIGDEVSRLAIFFTHYAVDRYSSEVFSCYEPPCDDNNYAIKKINELNSDLMLQMQGDWARLTELNPSLGKIGVDIDDPLNLFDAILGVASLFNVSDVDFFVTERYRGKSMDIASYTSNIPEYQKLRQSVDALCANCLRVKWVPSLDTLRHIEVSLSRSLG